MQQKGNRQSDSPIVPVKAGNAAGGKRKGDVPHTSAIQNHIKEETLSIHRDRRNNGNEIGENIIAVKRKPGHGIYIDRASNQQGTAERVS